MSDVCVGMVYCGVAGVCIDGMGDAAGDCIGAGDTVDSAGRMGRCAAGDAGRRSEGAWVGFTVAGAISGVAVCAGGVVVARARKIRMRRRSAPCGRKSRYSTTSVIIMHRHKDI